MDYASFLGQKLIEAPPRGIDAEPGALPDWLYRFQRDLCAYALRLGRAALFCDTGLGKTAMQLAWADAIGGDVLILAPLGVVEQTRKEGARFGVDVQIVRTEDDVRPGVNIANYERLDRVDPDRWAGVVLDESSILKNYTGATRNAIIEAFERTPYRLACTATPAPNDYEELGNHAEFLGVMTRAEMLACFFVHDGGSTQDWRLKGHAREDYWRWIASWAAVVRHPRDLGYDEGRFDLPPLNIHMHTVGIEHSPDGFLFNPGGGLDLRARRSLRRASVGERAAEVARLIAAEPEEPWLVWCDLNDEADALTRAIPDAVEVRGTDDPEEKARKLLAFADGGIRVLVTKPRIAGFGMNYQRSARMAFCGLSDSYERYYQGVRREWRYGQTRPVDVHVVTSAGESEVVHNVLRKEEAARTMSDLCTFRKPGENPERVEGRLESYNGTEEMPPSRSEDRRSIEIWQRYASPVWMDINPSRTLQRTSAREEADERHICPLQLDVIERALQLWTNPGDLVLSPFAGIGSEGFEAVRMGRRFLGIELKRSYWQQARLNLDRAAIERDQGSLFQETGS